VVPWAWARHARESKISNPGARWKNASDEPLILYRFRGWRDVHPWGGGEASGKASGEAATAVLRGMQFENRVPYNMLQEVTTEDLRRNLSNVINRAAYGSNPVVVTRRGRKIAAVVSIIDLALLERIKEQREADRKSVV
jgi:prevent-host-death family protein